MKKQAININKYKYIMFVDASGDDGYVFRETSNSGSSYSFVVSCFMTKPEDYAHNINVLLSMKKAMFVKPEQEIKSTALRRSRYSDRVYDELQNLKGTCFSLIADKKLIHECRPLSDRDFYLLTQIARNNLSGITHAFPYISLHDSDLISDNDEVLIVIDNMKKREMDSIKNILKTTFSTQKYDLIFRDSKDKLFPLIQIADVMAGTIRNYYENCLPLKPHNQYCKLCLHSNIHTNAKLAFSNQACLKPKLKKFFTPYITHKDFNIVMEFHQSDNEPAFGCHLVILPVDHMLYFAYIECLIINHKKRS